MLWDGVSQCIIYMHRGTLPLTKLFRISIYVYFIGMCLLRSNCFKIFHSFSWSLLLWILMQYFQTFLSSYTYSNIFPPNSIKFVQIWATLTWAIGSDGLQHTVDNPSLRNWERRLSAVRKFTKLIMLRLVSRFPQFTLSSALINHARFYLCFRKKKKLCWKKYRFPWNIQLWILPIIKFQSRWW